MKRIISLVLVIAMALTISVPQLSVQARDDEEGHKAEHYTYDGVEVPDAFKRNQMRDLLEDRKIIMPSNMAKVNVTETDEGVKFSGRRANLQAGRIDISKQFNFGENYVGRFSIEATRKASKPITIKFYVDADINAFCSMQIGEEGRKDPVTGEDRLEQSKVVFDEAIVGHHSLSFSFETECDEAEVTFKSFEFVQSSLPVVSFDIDEKQGTVDDMNTSEDHSAECHGTMNVNVPSGYNNEYANNLVSASYQLDYIRGRGNSTWWADKKPYKVKLASKAGMLGMGKNKHWVLLANAYDNSKMRNKMTYELARRLGMPYTPKSTPVDVVMNGEYYGTYYLSEQIRLGDNRVNIPDLNDTTTKLSDDEITGGYLLSAEGHGDFERDFFQSEKGYNFTMESPNIDDYANEETPFSEVRKYINGYVQDIEDAVCSEDFVNEKGQSYDQLLDAESVAKYYLFQEVSANGDAFANGSTYFFKDRGGKLNFGPLWDFDYVAWAGNTCRENTFRGFHNYRRYWIAYLLTNPEFFDNMLDYYDEMKAELNDMTSENGYIDQLADSLRPSLYYDIEKWAFFDHDSDGTYTYSFNNELKRLKKWINNRLAWIDSSVDNWAPIKCKIDYMVGGELFASTKVLSCEYDKVIFETPTKPGYKFSGWFYKDDEGQMQEFTDETELNGDLTVEAHFVEDVGPEPTTAKDPLTIYSEYLKNNRGHVNYSIITPKGGKPLLLVAKKLLKKKYAKKATVYSVNNDKMVKVRDLSAKKGYLYLKGSNVICKASKKSVTYWNIGGATLNGAKYVQKKKKYYKYTLKGSKWKSKKKLSKKKGKAYIKAKKAKKIVFTAG